MTRDEVLALERRLEESLADTLARIVEESDDERIPNLSSSSARARLAHRQALAVIADVVESKDGTEATREELEALVATALEGERRPEPGYGPSALYVRAAAARVAEALLGADLTVKAPTDPGRQARVESWDVRNSPEGPILQVVIDHGPARRLYWAPVPVEQARKLRDSLDDLAWPTYYDPPTRREEPPHAPTS